MLPLAACRSDGPAPIPVTERKGEQMAERAAIVTGASSGIGLATARVLAEEGFALTMSARRPEKLEGAVAGLVADGFDVQAVAANVADEAEIVKVVDAHRDRYGRLDVLVNNAGVGIGAQVGEIQTKHLDMQLRSTFARSCSSTASACRCCRPPPPSITTRSWSTPPRSPASTASPGWPSTRPPSTAWSAGRKP